MKRVFLILAICLIIALSAVWGYLLFFGAPESARDFFANFNFGDNEDTTVVQEVPFFEESEIPSGPTEPDALRQLTNRQVAGYTEVSPETSSSTLVYFIEAGTGHVYTLDTTSGTEERLSNITIPSAQHGAISITGTMAAIHAGDPGTGDLTLISLSGSVDSSTNEKVLTDIYSFSLTPEGSVLYSKLENGVQRGYSYNLQTDSTSPLFTLPFGQATILWGETAASTHYFFPKPAGQLEGYLYSVTGGIIARESLSGFGFSAQVSPSIALSSFITNGEYVSQLYDQANSTSIESPIDFIPAKCALSKLATGAVCAIPGIDFDPNSVTDWYKGKSSSDRLVFLSYGNGQTGSATILDLEQVSGQAIDVINIIATNETNQLFFQNKKDNSLWLYELP